MSHLLYLALLLGCLIGTSPLEFLLHVGVYVQWRRLLGAVVPTAIIFGGWDLYAIHRGQWSYNRHWLLGAILPGHLPLEELLFFLVVPVCAILTLEAVRRTKPHWVIGDEI